MPRSAAVLAPPIAAPAFQEGDAVYLRIPIKVRCVSFDEDGTPLVGIRVPTVWGGGTYFSVKPGDLMHARAPPRDGETPD